MKAMIPMAGKGTRLGNLTLNKPKALVEINGKTLLEHVLLKLKNQGFNEILINIHHQGQMIIDFLDQHKNFGVEITVSDERDQLLDTGGAILKAASFFKGDEPVLIHNVDIVSDTALTKLVDDFEKSDALAAVAVRNRNTSRKLLFDHENRLKGWHNSKTGTYKWVNEPVPNPLALAFSGVWITHPRFTDLIPFQGAFSIVDTWLEIAKTEKIIAWLDDASYWFDTGTPERLQEAGRFLARQ